MLTLKGLMDSRFRGNDSLKANVAPQTNELFAIEYQIAIINRRILRR